MVWLVFKPDRIKFNLTMVCFQLTLNPIKPYYVVILTLLSGLSSLTLTHIITRVMNPTLTAEISTAREMKCFFSKNLHHFRINPSVAMTMLDFWKKLVNNSTHSICHPSLVVAACASPPPNITCVLLDKDISTPDPSRVAWFTCTYSLIISPAIWKLTEELEELKDPPCVCTVSIEVSNLVFDRFASVNELKRLTRQPLNEKGVIIFYNPFSTESFKHDLKYIERFYHTYVTPQTTERIWFDLITKGRRGKNIFVMNMPFLFRIASIVPVSLQEHVYLFDKEELRNIPAFPDRLDPDSFIGLYSGTFVLKCLTSKESSLPLVNRELWPDIPQEYADIEHQRPGCVLNLSIHDLKFESTITEESIRCLIPRRRREYAVVNWFKPYLNIFNNSI